MSECALKMDRVLVHAQDLQVRKLDVPIRDKRTQSRDVRDLAKSLPKILQHPSSRLSQKDVFHLGTVTGGSRFIRIWTIRIPTRFEVPKMTYLLSLQY